MRSLLDIVTESRGMPDRIRVQAPSEDRPKSPDSNRQFKQVTVYTRPEITWMHVWPLSYHDEMQWQRRIPGRSKSGQTLCHEEGNYIYFLLENPVGNGWDMIGVYNTKEEMLYFDTSLVNFEDWTGAVFTVPMRELSPS